MRMSNNIEDSFTARWDERYSSKEYAYGEEPNEFLKSELVKFKAGSILFPADGEGRNSVFAAKLGWETTSFDISKEGKKKAEALAQKNNVSINYKLGNLNSLTFEKESFDVIALIYAHFSPELKSIYYKTFDKFLKKGGVIIFEAFSKKHLEYNTKNEKVGGPKDSEMLFSIDEIKTYFTNYNILQLEEKEIELNEGLYHIGLGCALRFVGLKKS